MAADNWSGRSGNGPYHPYHSGTSLLPQNWVRHYKSHARIPHIRKVDRKASFKVQERYKYVKKSIHLAN